MYSFDMTNGFMVFRLNHGKTTEEIKEEFMSNMKLSEDGTYDEIIDVQVFYDFCRKYECFI